MPDCALIPLRGLFSASGKQRERDCEDTEVSGARAVASDLLVGDLVDVLDRRLRDENWWVTGNI